MSTLQQSTTLVVGRDGNFGSLAQANSEINPILNGNLKGHYVGPHPVDKFLDKFLPVTTRDRDKTKFDELDFSGVVDARLEKGMYEPFVRAVSSLLPKNAEMFISADDVPETSTLRPDMGVRILPKATQSRHVREDIEIIREPFDFPRTDLCIEFKLHTEDDPFVDDLSRLTIEGDSDRSLQTRGQLAHYAHEQFSQQHRCHLFQVIVFGVLARFLYWDRSGSVVTERFNYVEEPRLLGTFLWRYTRASDFVRGLDPTVSLATEREATIFREVLCDFVRANKDVNRAELPWAYVSLDEAYPISRIRVQDGGKVRIFFVSRAFYVALGPCGRCTRTFLSCDIRERKTYILKDTWEVKDDPTTLSEWPVYDILEDKSVPSLLPRICGGEVLVNGIQQLTAVEELGKQPHQWRAPCSPMMRAYGHFRLVQDVAYPLQCLRNSQELVKVFYDVALCISKAKEAGVLHRDISIGNILFVRSDSGVRGVLIDWDHAQTIPQQSAIKAIFRSATRQFMSISLLEHPDREHEIVDDLQSLFWVFIYAGLHYVAHTNDSFLRYNHLFRPEQNSVTDPEDPHSYSAAGSKERVLAHQLLMNFPFRCTLFKELVTFLCTQWKGYLTSSIVAQDYPNIPELQSQFTRIRDKLSSPSWITTLFDDYRKKEGWEKDDIVTDQFPPMTRKDEKKYLTKRVTNTFDASHLPESVRTKAATQATACDQVVQRLGATLKTSNSIPRQEGKRLQEISDDSDDENEYGAPARKKARLCAPPKSPKGPATRSRRARAAKLPARAQPSRSSKRANV